MKLKCLTYVLMALVAIAIQLPAQQSESDRKLFEVAKAKAEKGDAEAQYNLGCCYKYGEGVPKDQVEAVKWYRKAAEQNNADAQFRLGISYADGDGVVKDTLEAMKWVRKAAEQNVTLAECYLGTSYYVGKDVAKDYLEAVKWFRKAAEQHHSQSQYSLGVCYANGEGVTKDEVEAVKWYRKAAEQDFGLAQIKLGYYYISGNVVAKDYEEGYKWFLLAAAKNDEMARKALPTIEDMLTREQIAEGQKLARNFKPRKLPESYSPNSAIEITEAQPTGSGSGFIITGDGFLITNQHVVEGAKQIRLVTSAGLISAKVVKVDAANDLALLKAEGRFAPLPLSSSRG